MNNKGFKYRSRSRRTILGACFSILIALVILTVPGTLPAKQFANSKTGQSDPIVIDVQIDKRKAQVAEPILLKITATAPIGVTIKFPELQKQLGDFEITGVKDNLDIPAGSNRNWIRNVSLESYISGELQIPAIEISYVDRRGSTAVAGLQATNAEQISIRSTLEGVEDPNQFRDIKSVVFAPETPPRNNFWLIASAVAAGFAVVAALVYVRLNRRSDLSPKNWAIKSIDRLRDSQAFKDNDTEQIYIRLVSILRTFVYWQFGISAPRLTTDEFLCAMQADDRLSAEFRTKLSELFELADMVKFAGLSPDGSQLTAVVDQAKEAVENAGDAEMKTSQLSDVSNVTSTGSDEFQRTAEDK